MLFHYNNQKKEQKIWKYKKLYLFSQPKEIECQHC